MTIIKQLNEDLRKSKDAMENMKSRFLRHIQTMHSNMRRANLFGATEALIFAAVAIANVSIIALFFKNRTGGALPFRHASMKQKQKF